MARRTTIITTCDLCDKETENPSKVNLGWNRSQWELDLCDRDFAAVSKQFDAWVDQGRKVTNRGGGGGRRTSPPSDLESVRAWARDQGLDVKSRGRIPGSVMEAYTAAQG
ncbi:MAG: hypothetical protein AVDCRST_MAG50-1528 [uncultured Acidimicrobiales bacterium]|uniref:Histone protein Lsr2 n=1 Tax=uncultured Acidimicrobiales bacterium TaxID=310071 RepID=A0A6J4I0M3_9ACTN|nr:MAG: hypothetical protein AVDCRST_MAG50-1528 [uncultured Acidimicrobiales bacterium]